MFESVPIALLVGIEITNNVVSQFCEMSRSRVGNHGEIRICLGYDPVVIHQIQLSAKLVKPAGDWIYLDAFSQIFLELLFVRLSLLHATSDDAIISSDDKRFNSNRPASKSWVAGSRFASLAARP